MSDDVAIEHDVSVIDAQVHVWGRLVDNPHTPQEPSFQAGQLLPLMAGAGVAGAVLVPPTWGADWNEACLRAAAEHPGRFAVMGRIAVEDPSAPSQLRRWRERPGMLGLRISLRRDPWATWFSGGRIEWLWQVAAEERLPVMVYLPGRLPELEVVARKHPGLKLLIDHMGILPGAAGAELERQAADAVRLAELDNVAVKVSALPLYSRQDPPFADIHPLVRRIIDAYGPARSFWGSDLTRLNCGYRAAVAMMDGVLSGMTPEERALVMGRGLVRWLGWENHSLW
jgi:predicted TIM-barrel fold metal-dependent hydrolase